jgi:hypothetical protein
MHEERVVRGWKGEERGGGRASTCATNLISEIRAEGGSPSLPACTLTPFRSEPPPPPHPTPTPPPPCAEGNLATIAALARKDPITGPSPSWAPPEVRVAVPLGATLLSLLCFGQVGS